MRALLAIAALLAAGRALAEMYRLLPKGKLAVLPVADHFAPMERPAWVVSMIRSFYEAK